jgi:anhydro-N-acetylmuramic acid kinase
LGFLYTETVEALLRKANVDRRSIVAIGNHGQTIRHRPRLGPGSSFTLQIGDSHYLAHSTGICVVADFRARDICVGGQGAPLVPGFHRAVFADELTNRSVLNIGGMANLTYLPAEGSCTGFDTGPGNGLMDAWIAHHLQQPFDADGNWAATGALNNDLLVMMLEHPFFALPPPKSTGKEEFTFSWLTDLLDRLPPIPAQDVQRTLLELTAVSISSAISQHCSETEELYICGGGVNNRFLWQRLKHLVPARLYSTESLGVAPQWVEAMAFAWLAKRCLDGLPGNLASVTGANQEVVLGAIYPAGVCS